MAPRDLLCRWCSTFVGKNKHFCSIFCESRHTRASRRKLAFRKPPNYSGQPRDTEFESPRNSKRSPRKDNFLEEVITAMDDDMSDKDKSRQNDTDAGTKHNKPVQEDVKKSVVPKLKLLPSGGETYRPELVKSKTQTLLTKSKSKVPIVRPTVASASLHSINKRKKNNSDLETANAEPKVKPKVSKSKPIDPQISVADKIETPKDTLTQPVQKQKSQLAIELEKKVNSSGYGAPVNPRLRPSALKPKSANFLPGSKRQSSASSTKSSNSIQTVPGLLTNDVKEPKAHKTDKGLTNLPATISEETARTASKDTTRTLSKETVRRSSKETPARSKRSLSFDSDTAESTPKSMESEQLPLVTDNGRTELEKINELIREETSASVFIDNSLLQSRLSSIKRKVEVRKRGRDSRSSMGSDMDAFMGSLNDITTNQEPGLELSSLQLHQKPRTLQSTRSTARANVTNISHDIHAPLTAK